MTDDMRETMERVQRDDHHESRAAKRPRDPALDACRRILRASEGTGIDVSPIELKKFCILLRLIESSDMEKEQ
jgi:hypothetical protein